MENFKKIFLKNLKDSTTYNLFSKYIHSIYLENDSLIEILSNPQISITVPPKISFCIMTFNEERCIYRCINSIINVADEIIVLDTGSTDNTLNIISSNFPSVKIIEDKWDNDFSRCRNLLIKEATNDWIFNIDADEYFIDNSINDLKSFLSIFNFYPYITISPQIVNFDDNVLLLTNRIFNKTSGMYFYGIIHEYLKSSNATIKIVTNFKLYHDGYKNEILISKDKINRNINLLHKMIKLDPNNLRWKYFLGREYIYTDKYYLKGITLLEEVANYTSKDSLLLNNKDIYNLSSLIILLSTYLSDNNITKLKSTIEFINSKYHNCLDSFYYTLLINYNTLISESITNTENLINTINSIEEPISYINSEFYHIYKILGFIYLSYGNYDLAFKFLKQIKSAFILNEVKQSLFPLYNNLKNFLIDEGEIL